MKSARLGKALAPEDRETIGDLFQAKVSDMYTAREYTAREICYITLQCPDHARNYHVQTENVMLEILRENNTPCEPGEVGRVVVTLLHNFAMPLIRYAIGDYAEVGEVCPCGRGLPVLTRMLGRVRNMISLPDGSQHWPEISYKACQAIAPIKQLRIVKRETETLEVNLATEIIPNREQEEALTKAIHEMFGWPLKVSFNYVDAIPRSASGKYEDFVSEL